MPLNNEGNTGKELIKLLYLATRATPPNTLCSTFVYARLRAHQLYSTTLYSKQSLALPDNNNNPDSAKHLWRHPVFNSNINTYSSNTLDNPVLSTPSSAARNQSSQRSANNNSGSHSNEQFRRSDARQPLRSAISLTNVQTHHKRTPNNIRHPNTHQDPLFARVQVVPSSSRQRQLNALPTNALPIQTWVNFDNETNVFRAERPQPRSLQQTDRHATIRNVSAQSRIAIMDVPSIIEVPQNKQGNVQQSHRRETIQPRIEIIGVPRNIEAPQSNEDDISDITPPVGNWCGTIRDIPRTIYDVFRW